MPTPDELAVSKGEAIDNIVDGLTALFDKDTLGRLLDDARDLEHGDGRDTKAWEQLADILRQAWSAKQYPSHG